MLIHATGLHTGLFALSLLVDVGCRNYCFLRYSVGDVGVAELEEPVDKPGTTVGAKFSVLHRLPFLMSCGF